MRSRVPLSQKEKLTEQGCTKSRKALQVPRHKAGPSPLSSQSRVLGRQLPSPTPHLNPAPCREILGDSAEMLEAEPGEACRLDTGRSVVLGAWGGAGGQSGACCFSLPGVQAAGLCLNLVCDVA